MKGIRKFFKILSVVIAVIGVVYGVYHILRRPDVVMPSLLKAPSGIRPVMSMQGFRFTLSEDGRTSWTMRAGNAELYENKEARLKDLQVTFTAPDQKEAALIGETGILDTGTGDASIHRGVRQVRIVTSDGYLLTTDSLIWNAAEREIRSPDVFKLLGSEIYLEGKGLLADVDIRKIAVNSNVKAVLQE